ncbi:MAG: CDP-alcohol phosphatidyltransferase family protein, partial [Planctomycetota bacterium]|nr:CDP-alcohol phosphatidyltransferase family protein [Planctomycetota bacterium]
MSEDLRRKLPNAITMARLVLAIGFFASLNAYRYPDTNIFWANLAIVLFCLAASTDALDGYLARKWDVTTVFGRIMDPFCDKFLILGSFIYLAGPRFVAPEWVPTEQGIDPDAFFTMTTGVYPWMVVVIFGRDLLVTSIRGVLESMGVSGEAQ